MKNSLKLLTLASAFAASSAEASTLVYYQMEGTSGVSAGGANQVADSSGNALNATAATFGGANISYTPVYSGVTVGAQIRDGVGGDVINSNNSTSLRYTNPGVATGHYATGTGGQVSLSDTKSATLKVNSFTAEAFVKVNDQIQFTSIMGITRSGGVTWQLDTSPTVSPNNVNTEPTNMNIRARTDHQKDGAVPISPATSLGNPDGFNQGFTPSGSTNIANASITTTGLVDGWHHVAMTITNGTDVALFVDYIQVATGKLSSSNANGTNALNYDDSGIFFIGGGGGRGFDGWIDEVRLSDTILTTDQFLRADIIPEPSHALLLLTGLTAFGLRRRR